jgi:cyclophilin family peptidyl-prolyl cis-trans isomerase
MHVFLDIDIGDAAAHASATAAHDRAAAYLIEKGGQVRVKGRKRAPIGSARNAFAHAEPALSTTSHQLGLDPAASLAALDADSRDLLAEAYAADPAWAARGPPALDPPPPLRAGRVMVELDTGATPRAAENFRCLCTGEKGTGKGSGRPLAYTGTPFHRIVRGFVAQGGDTVRGDGSGKESAFGAGTFAAEKKGLAKKHDRAGVVGMAGAAPACQFYITLAPAPAVDGKHVVVGRVVEGLAVLERIEAEAASEDGVPRVAVVVAGAGEIEA